MKKILDKLSEEHLLHKSSLKDDSFDSNNEEYLCQYENIGSFCFDSMVQAEVVNRCIKSVDSLYFDESRNKLYLIEFKNQGSINHKDMKIKIYESLVYLFGKLNLNYEYFHEEYIEILVVYNPEGNYQTRRHFERLGKPETNPLKPYTHGSALKDYFNIKTFICDIDELGNYLNIS